MAVAIHPGSLRLPYTYPTAVATMNHIDCIFEEGNVTPGQGVPYTPLAWDPLFIPQPVELAATLLPFPDPPSSTAKPVYLKDFRELPRMFNKLCTTFGALREEVCSES